MAGSITITGVKSFKDQSGDLTFVSPDATARPVNYWTVPRWWYYGENTIYESCVRLNNSANNDQIYISTSTLFPHLKVEWNGSSYIFDQDNKREYIDRIWITRDSLLREGTDYQVPLRGAIIQIGGSVSDLEYTINTSGTFTLRSNSSDYTVDWGDGSSLETSTSSALSHTYSSSGTYVVKINVNSGARYVPNYNNNADGDEITSIAVSSFGPQTTTSLNRSLKGSQNMTNYNQVAAATTAVTSFLETWAGTGLTSFPLIDTSSGTNFQGTWSGTGLTSFPLIDTSSGTNFVQTWNNCSGLTSFPLIDTSNGTNFFYTWRGCSGLTTFPLIDTSNGTDFNSTWNNCSAITSLPLIDTSSGTNFEKTWAGCSGLTTFPALNVSNGTNFREAWSNCSGLTTFPLLDVSNGTSFFYTWRGCSGLTTFPVLDTSSGTNFSNAWNGCVGLTSFPLINTSSGTNFNSAWRRLDLITTFPALNVSNGTDFGGAWTECFDLVSFPSLDFSSATNSFFRTWYRCLNLTTYPANQFDTTGTLPANAFNQAWSSCKLTAQSQENILTSLDTNGQQNIELGMSGSNQANASTWSTDAIIAYRNLVNKNWTITQNGTPAMSDLEYTINNSGTSFTLRSTGTVNYTVDWGDGSSLETSTSNTLAHTYSSSGTYVVKINSNSGATYRPNFNSSGDEDQITSIAVGSEDSAEFGTDIERAFRGSQNMTKYNQVGAATSSVSNFRAAWRDCSGLTSFPLIDISGATSINNAWNSCTGLTSFPVLDTSNVTNFGESWESCTGLTSFPVLDTSSGTSFGETWRNCSGLTTFPVLDTSSGTSFERTWIECSGLTSFPVLDTSNGTNFRGAWRDCTGLTSFPVLDTSSGTNFIVTWYNCSGLTTFPVLDTSSGTNFTQSWFNCNSLTSFPALNFSSGTNFQEAWNSTSSLTTYPANQFDTTGTLASTAFNNSWFNCALTAQSIENILTSLDTNGASNITLSLNGGTNASKTTWSTAANTAYNNLITKGWTIAYNS